MILYCTLPEKIKTANYLCLQKDIPANVTADALEKYMQSIKDIGTLQIIRSGDCAGYNWNVRWNNGGTKEQIKVYIYE